MKTIKWIAGILIVIVIASYFIGHDKLFSVVSPSYCNYKNLKEILVEKDARNTGINIAICRRADGKTLIINMIAIEGNKSRVDVFRYILQTAEELRKVEFERIEFAYKGDSKFYISGKYFNKLGDEYGWQNAIYTNRTFPENVKNMDDTYAFSSWSGGALGVMQKQMDDQIEFHNKWYIKDLTLKQ